MSYQPASKSCLVYNPITRQFISTRDIIFQYYNKEGCDPSTPSNITETAEENDLDMDTLGKDQKLCHQKLPRQEALEEARVEPV